MYDLFKYFLNVIYCCSVRSNKFSYKYYIHLYYIPISLSIQSFGCYIFRLIKAIVYIYIYF